MRGRLYYGDFLGSADNAVKDSLNEKLKYDENIHCGHHEHNDTNVMKINMDVQKISKKSPKMIIIIVPNNIIVTIKK